jgi:hypothetical protein
VRKILARMFGVATPTLTSKGRSMSRSRQRRVVQLRGFVGRVFLLEESYGMMRGRGILLFIGRRGEVGEIRARWLWIEL